MRVSVTADAAATAHDDDRYDHQQTKYPNAQSQSQAKSVGKGVLLIYSEGVCV